MTIPSSRIAGTVITAVYKTEMVSSVLRVRGKDVFAAGERSERKSRTLRWPGYCAMIEMEGL